MVGADSGLIRVAAAGDAALVAEFPARIDPRINDRARSIAASLRSRWGAILRDVVIGYCTVTVYFDPVRVDGRWLEEELTAIARADEDVGIEGGGLVEVPVCYEGDLAPDLDDVAAFGGCSREDVIERHAGREYRVYLVGFIPGFAYMAEVDPSIAAPRRSTPRTAVPAGSVAIAGGQTGIYPAVTPGGWNIIGRTSLKPCDPARREPFLFKTGDRVRFIRIDRRTFEHGA
jgi:KipI family sensor histidine kinase inhibitor